MTFSWQLHNIAIGNVGSVYQKEIFYFPELPDDLGTISCFTDTHSSCFLLWGLQINFSSQSYYENLTYILHPPRGYKKFQLSPISSPIRKGRICLRCSEWQRESKRNYSVNSLCGLLLQQGYFASIGNKNIMIHSLMGGWCSLIDTSTAWGRLWLHLNLRFIAFCGWIPMEKYQGGKERIMSFYD